MDGSEIILMAMDAKTMMARAEAAEAFLRSLASRHRLMILCSLLQEEVSVGELAHRLELSQSNLSRHLGMLREEGLVAARREGTVIHYRIVADRVIPILTELYRMFCLPDATSETKD